MRPFPGPQLRPLLTPKLQASKPRADQEYTHSRTKGACLGEMYQDLSGLGVIIPNGFTVSVAAYWAFF